MNKSEPTTSMHGTGFQKTIRGLYLFQIEEGRHLLQKLQQTIFLIHKSVINDIPFIIRVMNIGLQIFKTIFCT